MGQAGANKTKKVVLCVIIDIFLCLSQEVVIEDDATPTTDAVSDHAQQNEDVAVSKNKSDARKRIKNVKMAWGSVNPFSSQYKEREVEVEEEDVGASDSQPSTSAQDKKVCFAFHVVCCTTKNDFNYILCFSHKSQVTNYIYKGDKKLLVDVYN